MCHTWYKDGTDLKSVSLFLQLIYPLLPCSFLHNAGFSGADKTYQQTPLQRFGVNRLFSHVIICRLLV